MTAVQKLNNYYQRLEFLGDRVLNLIVSHYLYKKFPDYSEGELTDKLKFTSNDNLEEIIDNLPDEFKTELFTFKCYYKPDAEPSNADDVEAFVGNYYLEHDFEASRNYFEKRFIKEIDAFDPDTDYISKLQVYTQKSLKNLPDYKLVNEEMGQNNQHIFYFEVFVGNELFGTGHGSTKSKAKRQAALVALKKLGFLN